MELKIKMKNAVGGVFILVLAVIYGGVQSSRICSIQHTQL
jgi:hypothetical protein